MRPGDDICLFPTEGARVKGYWLHCARQVRREYTARGDAILYFVFFYRVDDHLGIMGAQLEALWEPPGNLSVVMYWGV